MRNARSRNLFLTALVLCSFVLGGALSSVAETAFKTIEVVYRNITITVNGKEIHPVEADGTPLEPFAYNGRVYLPVRAVSEALGKTVTWDGDSGTVSISEPVTAPEEITVSTAAELIAAFGSNRRITLNEGTYNLSELGGGYLGGGPASWREVFDGGELVLSDIHNMELVGGGKAKIVVSPRYAFVLCFENSGGIKISGITAGHTEGGYCTGGVFSFDGCSGITLENTKMYGCGTEGLFLKQTGDFRATSCEIFECTYGIMTVLDCQNVSFDNCVFRDNREFTMISVSGTSGFSIAGSEFLRNVSDHGYPMFSTFGSEDVTVSGCRFAGNTASAFETGGMVRREGNTFSDNSFDGTSK